MSGLDLDAIEQLVNALDDAAYGAGWDARDAVADDGGPPYPTDEDKVRARNAARAAIVTHLRALTADLAAARAEADGLRGLVGEACDLYGVLFARYNTLRASAGLALDGGDGKIVAIRARAGKTGGR